MVEETAERPGPYLNASGWKCWRGSAKVRMPAPAASTENPDSAALSQELFLNRALMSSVTPSMIWRPVGAYPVLVDHAYPQVATTARYTAVCTLHGAPL